MRACSSTHNREVFLQHPNTTTFCEPSPLAYSSARNTVHFHFCPHALAMTYADTSPSRQRATGGFFFQVIRHAMREPCGGFQSSTPSVFARASRFTQGLGVLTADYRLFARLINAIRGPSALLCLCLKCNLILRFSFYTKSRPSTICF